MLLGACLRCGAEADLDRCVSGPGGGCLLFFCRDHWAPDAHDCQSIPIEQKRLSAAAHRDSVGDPRGMGLSAAITGMGAGLRERFNGSLWILLVLFALQAGQAVWFFVHLLSTDSLRERFVVVEAQVMVNERRMDKLELEVLREIRELRAEVRVLGEQAAVERGRQAR